MPSSGMKRISVTIDKSQIYDKVKLYEKIEHKLSLILNKQSKVTTNLVKIYYFD